MRFAELRKRAQASHATQITMATQAHARADETTANYHIGYADGLEQVMKIIDAIPAPKKNTPMPAPVATKSRRATR